MKVKELRTVLSSNMVNIYSDLYKKEIYIREKQSEDNTYLNLIDKCELMWEMWGEYEIEQIYSEDSETINIDIGGV